MNKQKEERLASLQAKHQSLARCHSEASKHEETHRRQSDSILPDAGSYFPSGRASNMIAWSERRYHQARWEAAKQAISRRMRKVKKKFTPNKSAAQPRVSEKANMFNPVSDIQYPPNGQLDDVQYVANGQYITVQMPGAPGNQYFNLSYTGGTTLAQPATVAQPVPEPEPIEEDEEWDDDDDYDENVEDDEDEPE